MKRPTESYISANLFEGGLGHVAIAPFRGNGEVEVGAFLVDVNCLGVKDAFYTRIHQTEFDHTLLDRILPAENRNPLDPPSARKLVEGAVAYARDLGFALHTDYNKACRVWGGINPADSAANFPYGSNGKPFYGQGPHVSLERCRQILTQPRHRCGDDNFDFLVVTNEGETAVLERAGFKIRQKVPAPTPKIL